MCIFDSYLINEERIQYFSPILKNLSAALIEEASQEAAIHAGDFSATSAFFIPEIEMLCNLFFDPEKVTSPELVFALGKGWKIA